MKILTLSVGLIKLFHTGSSLFTCLCILMFAMTQNQSNLTHTAMLSSWEPNKKWERLVSKSPSNTSGIFPPEAKLQHNHLDWFLSLEWYLSVQPFYHIRCMIQHVNKNFRVQSTNSQSPVRPKDITCFIRVYSLLVHACRALANTCYIGLKQIQVWEGLTGSS